MSGLPAALRADPLDWLLEAKDPAVMDRSDELSDALLDMI